MKIGRIKPLNMVQQPPEPPENWRELAKEYIEAIEPSADAQERGKQYSRGKVELMAFCPLWAYESITRQLMTKLQAGAVAEWISENIAPRRSFNYKVSSYGLKHLCEKAIGGYVSNDEMKASMIAAGYTPSSAAALTPCYKITVRKERK